VLGLEGIIAKRKGSIYEPGRRSGAWLKYKIYRSQFVIGGYTTGGPPFDALIVGVYEGARLNFVAKVRNGFVPRVRREVFDAMRDLETETCPFANLPEKKRTMWALTADEMKECRWVKPQLVAHNKESLVLIRSVKRGLILHFLFFKNEIRDFDAIAKGEGIKLPGEQQKSSVPRP
jgi:ATP-dependent DNA ligase